MNTNEKELLPGYRRREISTIKGTRTRHVVTLNPNKANPGEELYVDIPKTKANTCLVPSSLHLLFDFKSSNAKSWFLNNLSRQLSERLVIKLAGETVYDNSGESVIGTYKDLWKSRAERTAMVEYGIANENLRKLISKDDSGATSGNIQKVSDALMFSIHGTKQKVQLNKILEDHGLYAPYNMNNNLRYVITFPKASDIMVAQSGSAVAGYTLENLELEYETIESQEVTDEVSSLYTSGRSLSYEHVTLMKTVEWDKGSTLVNENINLPRKSMKAIVLLFTNKTKTDSEEFVYPNIESVKLTIEGVPNMVYSQGIPKSRLWEEAKRLFGQKLDYDQHMTVQKFYKDGFALVVDLRSIEDNAKVATGKKIVNTQSGILMEISKKVTTVDVMCRLFVLSDGLVNLINNDLQSIQY